MFFQRIEITFAHKLIEFYGIKRSGTHAIIKWLFFNFCNEDLSSNTKQVTIDGQNHIIALNKNKDFLFINDLKINKEKVVDYLSKQSSINNSHIIIL